MGHADGAFHRCGVETPAQRRERHRENEHLRREHFSYDFRGCLTACAASTEAIGEASEILRRGDADFMIGGGAHSMIHPFGVTGFNRLTALSTLNENPTCASRPFDAHRGGFVLGEGAGMVILETLELAQNRGAKILAEVLGYGSTADAFRITDPEPDSRGA